MSPAKQAKIERNEFLRTHGPQIEAMFSNQPLISSVAHISRLEITKLREESVEMILQDNPHAAKLAAAKSEGIFDFVSVLERIAQDYGRLKTSAPE